MLCYLFETCIKTSTCQKLKEKGRSKLQRKLTQTDNACFEKGRVS